MLGWYLELGEKPEGTAQSYRVDGGWRRQAGRLVVLAGAPEGVLRWASGIPWRRPSPSEHYPNMHELCNHHAHPPPPPPTRKHDCLLLTVLKQSRHSRAAALQGCTAPVGHFLGCHSLGKHLLVSVTVTQHGHAAETPTPHPQHQIEMSKHCTRSLQD